MLAHLDLHIQVTRRAAVDAGLALSGEPDAVPGIHSGGNLHRQGLALFDPRATSASAAGVGDDLAGTTTPRTGLLQGEEPLGHANLPRAAAVRARCGPCTGLGAGTVAVGAGRQNRHPNLYGVAADRFL